MHADTYAHTYAHIHTYIHTYTLTAVCCLEPSKKSAAILRREAYAASVCAHEYVDSYVLARK